MVKALPSSAGVQVRSLVRELRFHVPCDAIEIFFFLIKITIQFHLHKIPRRGPMKISIRSRYVRELRLIEEKQFVQDCSPLKWQKQVSSGSLQAQVFPTLFPN